MFQVPFKWGNDTQIREDLTVTAWLSVAGRWICADLADFDHVQLLLESSQHGVVEATGALSDGAPLLRVRVVTSQQETGHDAPWWENTHIALGGTLGGSVT